MVAKKKKGAAPEQAPQEGWGDPPTASSPPADDWGAPPPPPEDRGGVSDEAWEAAAPAGANAHGLGPDEDGGPNPDYQPSAVEPSKPRKRVKAGSSESPPPETPKEKGGNAHPLVRFVERYERLAEEKSALVEDMKELMGEIKLQGYCSAALRKVLQRRKQDQDELAELETLIDEYERILR